MRLVSDDGPETCAFFPDTVAASHVAAEKHFIDCLETRAEFENSGEQSLKTVPPAHACYLSAKEGKDIDPERLVRLKLEGER